MAGNNDTVKTVFQLIMESGGTIPELRDIRAEVEAIGRLAPAAERALSGLGKLRRTTVIAAGSEAGERLGLTGMQRLSVTQSMPSQAESDAAEARRARVFATAEAREYARQTTTSVKTASLHRMRARIEAHPSLARYVSGDTGIDALMSQASSANDPAMQAAIQARAMAVAREGFDKAKQLDKQLEVERKREGNNKEEKGILDRYITRGGILRGATGLIGGIANLQQVAMANPGQQGAVTLAGREMVGGALQGLGTTAVLAGVGGPIGWAAAIGGAVISAVAGIDKARYQRGTENQQRAMALQSGFSTSFGMWNPNRPAGSTALQNFGELRAENYKRSLPFDKQTVLEDMLRPGADLSKYSSHAKQRYSKYLGLQASTSPDVGVQNTFMYLRDQMSRGPYGMLEGEFAQAYGQAVSGFGMTQDYMPRGRARKNMRETWYQASVADPERTATILRGLSMARGTGMGTDALFSLLGSGSRMGGGGLDEISGVIGAMQRSGMSMPAINQMGGTLAQQVLAAEKMGIRTDLGGMGSMMGGLAASGIQGPRLGNLGEGFMSAQKGLINTFGGYKEGLLQTIMTAYAAQNAPPGMDPDIYARTMSMKDLPRMFGGVSSDLASKALQGQGLGGGETLSQLFKHTEADMPWWRQTPEAELQAALLRSSGVGMDVVQSLSAAATSLNTAAALLKHDLDGTKASAGLGR